MTNGSRYTRLRTLPVPEGLTMIGKGRPPRRFYGALLRFNSARLRTFLEHGAYCVRCGLQATHWAIEADKGRDNYHLNLYGMRQDGKEIVLTRDHVKPKSKGGSNSVSNSQPMCEPCNVRKADKYDETVDKFRVRSFTALPG